MIQGPSGLVSCDPLLEALHDTRNAPRRCRIVRDDPFMHGFGRALKVGDVVLVKGTVEIPGGRFGVAVESECAFYDYSHFELLPEESV